MTKIKRPHIIIYQPLAETWHFYDNSASLYPRLIAMGSGKDIRLINDTKTWKVISGENIK